MNVTKLPAFDNPPAVETVMGFYFAQLAGWNPLHLGQLFTVFQSEYPHGEMLAPVADLSLINSSGPVSLLGALPLRAAFSNSSRSQLVQVQQSFFMRNWRKGEQGQKYAHYSDLKPRFMDDWKRFNDFLHTMRLEAPQVYRSEVIYVNHLVRGEIWNSYNDLAALLKPIAERASEAINGRHYAFLPEAATVNLVAGYNLAELGVSLQIQAQSAIRQPDGTEVVQLTVTGQGKPVASSNEALIDALDRCHDAVILGFDDVTTSKAHEYWEKH